MPDGSTTSAHGYIGLNSCKSMGLGQNLGGISQMVKTKYFLLVSFLFIDQEAGSLKKKHSGNYKLYNH